MYSHLNREQRLELGFLLREGCSLRRAAGVLGVSHSALSRELRRNAASGATCGYHPGNAQRLAGGRRAAANAAKVKIKGGGSWSGFWSRRSQLPNGRRNRSAAACGLIAFSRGSAPEPFTTGSTLRGGICRSGQERLGSRTEQIPPNAHFGQRPGDGFGREDRTPNGTGRLLPFPGERGRNENANGLLRCCFPKKNSFAPDPD